MGTAYGRSDKASGAFSYQTKTLINTKDVGIEGHSIVIQ
jgi:hypothetical protein